MKLGNLVSQDLKKQLFTLASSDWDRLTPERRQKATKSYIIRHKLGQRVAEFLKAEAHKPFVVSDMPKPRLASEWVCNHAMALAGESAAKPLKAVHQSLKEIFAFHGMPETRAQELYQAFDSFGSNQQ